MSPLTAWPNVCRVLNLRLGRRRFWLALLRGAATARSQKISILRKRPFGFTLAPYWTKWALGIALRQRFMLCSGGLFISNKKSGGGGAPPVFADFRRKIVVFAW